MMTTCLLAFPLLSACYFASHLLATSLLAAHLVMIPLVPNFLIFAAIVIIAHWVWLFGFKKGGNNNSYASVSKKGYQTGGYQTGGSKSFKELDKDDSSIIARPSISLVEFGQNHQSDNSSTSLHQSFQSETYQSGASKIESSPSETFPNEWGESKESQSEHFQNNAYHHEAPQAKALKLSDQSSENGAQTTVDKYIEEEEKKSFSIMTTSFNTKNSSKKIDAFENEVVTNQFLLLADSLLIEKYSSFTVGDLAEKLQKHSDLSLSNMPLEEDSQREEIKRLAILTQKTDQQYCSALESIEAILSGVAESNPIIID
ncbi:hypothetical protein [Xanthocytophaga flava]|uniref:hypothetical protein n=1 Tax=Xanthocytophaga flava TaxID=3048013 RepID=UPI0028D85269|nr:hypothetical protein [Xanthocytophaga flavus]MDJ1470233.1 hypothetical protein [Xanthocytophaga flavus]